MRMAASWWNTALCAGCLALALPAFAEDAPPMPPPGMGDPSGPGEHHPGGHMGQEHMGQEHMGPGHMGPGPMEAGPLAGLARAEADQAAAQTIAELAKAPLPDVQRIVRTWDVPTALRYFDVTPQAFHASVMPRLAAVVRAAAQAQEISPSDADRMVGRLEHQPPMQPMPPAPPPE